jgi:[lysine-biosynthesis-protein LysW]--L-2-aminoadipate ligase
MAVLVAATTPGATEAALVRAFRRAGAAAAHAAPASIAERARPGDVVLGRIGVSASLAGPQDGLWVLEQLAGGVRVLNGPSSLLVAHDKLATAIKLGQAGVPHPRTVQVDDSLAAPELDYPLVVKPRFGSRGSDVLLCRSAGELRECLQALERRAWFRQQGALVQELVPVCGYDLRVVVAGGEVIGAIERCPRAGDWRTGTPGAGQRTADPPSAARALALAAAAELGCDLAGVDLLPTHDGSFVVLELDGAVDFTRSYALDGRDPFDAAARALLPASAAELLAVAASA